MASKEVKNEPNNLTTLSHSRQYLRQKFSRKFNNLSNNYTNFSIQECQDSLDYLKSLFGELSTTDREIGTILFGFRGESAMLNDINESESYEQKFESINSKLRQKISELSILNSAAENSDQNFTGREINKLKLPELPLPKFSNLPGEDLIQFFLNFEQIIDKYNLSDYERFVYLERQLSSDPLTLVKSLTGSKKSYTEAKNLLNQAFARPIKKKLDVVKQLSDINFNEKEPYEFVSQVKLIIGAFDSLEIDNDIIIQYFVWSRLPIEYQREILNLSGNSYPSIEDIQSHIFVAIDRIKSKTFINSKLEPTSLAANIKTNFKNEKTSNSFKNCSLCPKNPEPDHPIHKCTKYLSAKSKVDRLKELNLCIKCGGIKHSSRDCNFKFYRPCKTCEKQNHFSYLCLKEDQKSVSNGTCSIEFNCSSSTFSGNSSNLLPTFSCKIRNKLIRVLQDTGAQTSFIKSEIAEFANLKRIKSNIDLKIRGFNEQKIVKTNIVDVVIELGKSIFHIPAICVPNLTSSCPNDEILKISRNLSEKGYILADHFIKNDYKKPLDMILGIDALQHLELSTINFGTSLKSCMIKTSVGVMPVGDSSIFIQNLKYLPQDKSSILTTELVSTDMQFAPARPGWTHPVTSNACITHNSIPHSEQALHVDSSAISGTSLTFDNFFLSCDYNFEGTQASIETFKAHHLERECSKLLNYDDIQDSIMSDVDQHDCETVLKSIYRDGSGRLVVPLIWDKRNSDFLANNFNLSKQILISMKNKLEKDPSNLKLVDDVIKTQLEEGIIEPIQDLKNFVVKNPNCSFIAHMPIFKYESETTKCRIVYLSNLKEKSRQFKVSHNECLLPGGQLNRTIETSLSLPRFGKKLLIFDIKKAFLQLGLNEVDKNKLCFLWFENATRGNFSIKAYRCSRVPFGLRSSCTLLMLSLYYILIFSVKDNDENKFLKKLLYELFYVDNGAISSNNSLLKDFEKISSLFKPYGIELQTFHTNEVSLRENYKNQFDSDRTVKLLGLDWDTFGDKIGPRKLHLDINANTKRKILSTIAGNYDIFNIAGPILNRSRIFLHELQINPKIKWDDILSIESLKLWRCIAKQVNESPEIRIPRFVGDRFSKYNLITYVDASNNFYGAVVYLYDIERNSYSFFIAKNRMVTNNLKSKSIASLELMALDFGTKLTQKIYRELVGPKTPFPIKIMELKIFR